MNRISLRNNDNLSIILDIVKKDFHDIQLICPHCGANSHMILNCASGYEENDNKIYCYALYKCTPCKRISLAVLVFLNTDQGLMPVFDGYKDIYPVYITSADIFKYKDFIPSAVWEDYEEAIKCFSISAYRASACMFRRALQNSLLELGSPTDKTLYEQIEEIESLTKDMKDWAHEIRLFGNMGAHPNNDGLENIEKEEVNTVKEFMDNYLNYVYILPKKVKLSKSRRNEILNHDSE